MRRLIPGLLAALCLPWPVLACLNDRDSESSEGRARPEVFTVITGQFDRNPPLYYEMRLKRVAEAIEATPVALPLYDDAAVACDRLGRFDEAIAWMEKKRALLERSDGESAAGREQWYRYYANAGTHRAHRWIKAGADRDRIGEMVEARDLIARAIAIKPDAHFGREKFQLKAMDWIIRPPEIAPPIQHLPTFLATGPTAPPSEAIEGLAGLIVLGNAWESVDVFNALAQALESYGEKEFAYQARLRCIELAGAGRHSLVPGAPVGEALQEIFGMEASILAPRESVEALHLSYKAGRQQGEERRRSREAFMLARLNEGRHPDTDATFWNGSESSFYRWERGEDTEPTRFIPPLTLPHVVAEPASPWWFPLRGLMVTAGMVAGALLIALRLRVRARPPRKPVPVDVEWL